MVCRPLQHNNNKKDPGIWAIVFALMSFFTALRRSMLMVSKVAWTTRFYSVFLKTNRKGIKLVHCITNDNLPYCVLADIKEQLAISISIPV